MSIVESFVKTAPYLLLGFGIALMGMGVLVDFDLPTIGIGCACLATGKYLSA